MAFVHFDSKYAPCGFVIVKRGSNPYSDDAKLIQSDWDFPGVATAMGWEACSCGSTDGTVDCEACNRDATAMIGEAGEFIRDRAHIEYATLDDYLA